ncbi:hypothetical protein AUJ65_03750 [Candidatus Micrarchaeota archaeon CG1_02_51_15]|nr:MAG: hypothetical protein AUJ65_03750 [Candidatus Micrarchaeota archaeon CG1_02_51_15]
MNALVVGGARGFGKALTDGLSSRGYDVITASRSKHGCASYYSCDVGDLDSWRKTLKKIRAENGCLDFLACSTGFAAAKRFRDLTSCDWNQAFAKNVTYAALALQELTDLLRASNNPRALTIGSQWSYETGCDELVPYAVAKHALRTLTEDFAERNPSIKINHYCPPSMDTASYWKVRKSFQRIEKGCVIRGFNSGVLADPEIIAVAIISHAVKTRDSGRTFTIRPDGSVRVR